MTIFAIILILAAAAGIATGLTYLEKKWFPNAWEDQVETLPNPDLQRPSSR